VAYYMAKAYLEGKMAPAVPPEAAPEVKPAPKGRRRAHHPAGAEEAKPGTYVANDPATEVNEAWVEE
jgi:hypothetical protein